MVADQRAAQKLLTTVGMIQTIINDAKTIEDVVKDSKAFVQEKTKSQVNKVKEKSKAEEDFDQATQDKENARLDSRRQQRKMPQRRHTATKS